MHPITSGPWMYEVPTLEHTPGLPPMTGANPAAGEGVWKNAPSFDS